MAAAAALEIPDFQTESVSTGRVVFTSESLGQQVYDRDLPKFDLRAARSMRYDAKVHASVEFLVDAILSDGLQFSGAKYEGDAEFDESEQIKDFIGRCLMDHPQQPFLPTVKELIRGAIYSGHKVAEVVARTEQVGDDKGRYVLDKLKVKPNRATAFVVDEFFNVLGLVGIRKGQYTVTTGQIAPEHIIPRDKFFICTLETEDSDPRGVIQTRAAFAPLCDKRENRKQFSVWRKKCAVRSFIAVTGDKAMPVQVRDASGNVKTIAANQTVANTLAKMSNDTVGVFSFGTVVTPLDADGTGEQFKLAHNLSNSEIAEAILLQTMATGEADKGGLGAGGHQTHERVLGRRVDSFRLTIADQIYDLCRLFTSLNFGADKVHLTPSVSLGRFDKQEMTDKRTFYKDAGYTLDGSQFDEIDAEVGAPRRDMTAITEPIKDTGNE